MRTVRYQGESEGVCGQRGVEHLCPCVGEYLFEYGVFKFVGMGLSVGLSHGSSGSKAEECVTSGIRDGLSQAE